MPGVGGSDDAATNCANTEIANCAYGCKIISARPIFANQCVGPAKVVACGMLGCGALIVRARDPQGNDWQFPSTCIPMGWETLPGGSGPTYPECADADANDAAK
jgi:hypothetical protein